MWFLLFRERPWLAVSAKELSACLPLVWRSRPVMRRECSRLLLPQMRSMTAVTALRFIWESRSWPFEPNKLKHQGQKLLLRPNYLHGLVKSKNCPWFTDLSTFPERIWWLQTKQRYGNDICWEELKVVFSRLFLGLKILDRDLEIGWLLLTVLVRPHFINSVLSFTQGSSCLW